MRNSFPACIVTVALATAPLAGCVSLPGQPDTRTDGRGQTSLVEAANAASRPTVSRQVVQTAAGPRIRLQWKDRVVWLSASKDPGDPASEELVSALLLVAADMLVAGARAWLVYALTHRGAAFDRDACARAIVTAMLAEALSAVPVVGSVLSGLLLPVVLAWIARSGKWPWQADMGAVLATGADLHQALAKALAKAMPKVKPGTNGIPAGAAA